MKPLKVFAPHIDKYRSSLLVSVAGLSAGIAGWVFQMPVLSGVVGLAAAYQAWRLFKDGTKRHHGVDVEAAHLDKLRVLTDARGWKLDTEVWVDGVGNLDAVVDTGYSQFIVELKSYLGLKELPSGAIVRCNKAQTSAAKEVKQVQDQVFGYWGISGRQRSMMTPVLWCPDARHGTAKSTLEGVVLVNAGAEKLVEFMAGVSRAQEDDFMKKPLFPEEAGLVGARRPQARLGAMETVFARVGV
jgi:hypothetical protein